MFWALNTRQGAAHNDPGVVLVADGGRIGCRPCSCSSRPPKARRRRSAGAPFDAASVAHPELSQARNRVRTTLARVSAQKNALAALGLGETLAGELAWNLSLDTSPADAAARVYTGVLYDAAGAATWDEATLARAAGRLRILSGLWGALSPADRIPAYRLSMGVALGRIGPLAAFWRPLLAKPLEALADGGLVVDCRSSTYAAAWRPAGADWVTVKVLTEANGKRTVVSHFAKHARGVLAGALVRLDAAPASASDLADAARDALGHALVAAELAPPPTKGPRELALVLRG